MELNITFVIQAVLLLVLGLWLSKMFFEPFMKLFAERERRIVGAAAEAKALLGSADQAAANAAERTRVAQADARKVLASLREAGLAREQAIVDAARTDAQGKLEEARSELFEATETARRTLRADAQTLSADIVKKVLGRAA